MGNEAARVEPADHLIYSAAALVGVPELLRAEIGRTIERHRHIDLTPGDGLHAFAHLLQVSVRDRLIALAQARLVAHRAEVVHEAGFDFLTDLRCAVGYVSWEEHGDVFGFSVMSGCLERVPVYLNMFRQLGKRVDR